MKTLIAKELQLVLHPATVVLVALGLLVLIPSWPYTVILFYACLSVFFNTLNARETHDMDYTFPLPVSRSDMVSARVLVVVGVEVVLVAIMFLVSLARPVLGMSDFVVVGMPLNLAFFGFAFVIFALFNAVFFPLYYRDTMKVGFPFLVACVPTVVVGLALEVAPHVVPLFRDCLAAAGSECLVAKAIVLAVGIAVFIGATMVTLRVSQKVFSRVDM